MIPVSIDISETIEEFVLNEDEVKSLSNYILDSVVTEYVRNWESQIDQSLHSTRNEYKRGIFSETSDDSVIIGLTPRQSPMAMMIEDGASPFDEKEGFKNSNKKKQGKNGWYLTVPFRWATSEAIGEASIFSNKMPKPIEKIVKVSSKPLTMEDIPGQFKKMGKNITSGYDHKFNIYEGLHRQEIGSGTEKRGGYFSFRRVSENSDPGAWIHPGFEAYRLMDKALEDSDIGTVVDRAIDEFLKSRENNG
jgi:hypothetical protein